MFSLCALVVTSADVSNIPPGDKNSVPLQWQTTLMDRFYSPKSEVMAESQSTKERKVEQREVIEMPLCVTIATEGV